MVGTYLGKFTHEGQAQRWRKAQKQVEQYAHKYHEAKRRSMTTTPIDLEFQDSHFDTSNWSVYDGGLLEVAGQEIRVRGFLIYEDDKWLVVALAVNDNGHSVGRMVIPKVAITARMDKC